MSCALLFLRLVNFFIFFLIFIFRAIYYICMQNRKFLIGLTGNIASGKSSVGKLLKENGLPVIEADRIGWEILERKEIIQEILDVFGNILKDGKVDRKKLGNIVFSNKRKLRIFNAIVQSPLLQKLKREIEKRNGTIIVVNAALIFEWEIEHWFDKIILVTSEKKKRIDRLLKNNLTRKEAIQRINSQIDEKEKIKKSDFIIENNGTKTQLKEKILSILPLLSPNLPSRKKLKGER